MLTAPFWWCARKSRASSSAKSQCFAVTDKFVVAYEIDYAGAYRNLLDVCPLKDEGLSSLEPSLGVPDAKD